MLHPEQISVTVSVDDAHRTAVDQVADRLRAAGMHVERSLRHIGAISGHVTRDRFDGLKRIEGVAGVEAAQTFRVPSPDAKVQ